MNRFIDPKTLARIKDMPLVAKTVAEGFLHGLQNSRQRGLGIEFNQYRSYQPGDELSRIDWKLYARSDRYFVREAERESEIETWFLLDSSLSMSQQTAKHSNLDDASKKTWSKFEYARHLIASLAYIAQKQGDSIGYCSLSSASSQFLPAGNSERHWRKLLLLLAKTQCQQQFPDSQLVKQQIAGSSKPALIFVVSDFNQINDEITQFVSGLKTPKTEVVGLQLTCPDEMTFDYHGAIRFKDLETQEEVLVSAATAKSGYLKAIAQYQSSIQTTLAKAQVELKQINIEQPLDFALYEYLKLRSRNNLR